MKYLTQFLILVVFLTLSLSVVKGQLLEDFSDGDFTSNPTWTGDVGDFQVASGELQLSNTITDDSHLMFPSTLIKGTTWEFLFRWQDFSSTGLSSSNEVFFYLAANQNVPPETSDIQGYFVRIGNTEDEISLYRQDSDINSSGVEEIIRGSENGFGGVTASSNGSIRVRVTRDTEGLWTLEADVTGGVDFVEIGTKQDVAYETSSYAGIFIDYSAGNSDGYFFDDIVISAELHAESILIEDANTIRISFNQAVEENSATLSENYAINNGIDVNAVVRDAVKHHEVVISTSALSTSDYQITISNVQDDFTATPLGTPIVENFEYLQLSLTTLETISESEIKLVFNDNLDQASAENVANYSIDNSIGTPVSAELDPTDASVVSLNLGSNLSPLIDYTLTYGGIINNDGNSEILPGSTEGFTFVVPLTVDGIQVLSKNSLKLTFNLDLDQSTAENQANYSIDNEIGIPVGATLSASNKVLLTLGADLQENDYILTINNVEDVAHNAIPADTQVTFDYLPLSISNIEVLSPSEIEVEFNQDVEEMSGQLIGNYSVNFEIESPQSATIDPSDNNKVRLTFDPSLVNNDYTLTVSGVKNASGNAIAEGLTTVFEVEVATGYRQVVINEVFADPTPPIGLPTLEFVELYNATDRAINIGGFQLTGGAVEDFVLDANGYVILTETNDVESFQGYGAVAGVSSWNTLGNDGEPILLVDNLGNLVDSIAYTPAWHTSEKTNGGWTLEQINPELLCNYDGNWSSSISSTGGTPGAQNSIYNNSPDTNGPGLSAVEALNENTLQLTFDEPIDEVSFASADFDISLDNHSLEINSVAPGYASVNLVLEEPLVSGNTYLVSATGLTDCAGNAITGSILELEYDVEPPVLDRIVIVSQSEIELLFNEALDEQTAEQEENYQLNNSSEPESAKLSEVDDKRVLLTFVNEFIPQLSNEMRVEGLADAKGNVMSTAAISTFAYEQAIDTVMVKSINQLDVKYSHNTEKTTSLDVVNYSVDNDVGNPTLIYADEHIDNLFHLVFENNFDDNKELTLTTTNIKNTVGEYLSTPEYYFVYDTRAPRVDGLTVINHNTIDVAFDERVEQLTAESVENYSYDDVFSASRTLAASDSIVRLEFEQPFEREVVYELEVENIKDVHGNEMTSRARVEFTYDVFPPELDSVITVSDKELILIFNEPLEGAGEIGNYVVGEGVGNPLQARLNAENRNMVTLIFEVSFPELPEIPITITNLKDTKENSIVVPVESTFNYESFYISRITPLSAGEVAVEFNKAPQEATVEVVSNFTLNGNQNPTNIALKTECPREIVLTFPTSLEDNSLNTLAVGDVRDGNENSIALTDYEFSFDSRFSGLKMLNNNSLELEFETGIDPASLQARAFELTPYAARPIAITQDPENNRLVRLVFGQDFDTDVEYTLSWFGLSNEFGNTIPDFFTSFSKDELPPEVLEVEVLSGQKISITFSETLSTATVEVLSNFMLSEDFGAPALVDYQPTSKSVTLTFDDHFQDNTSYQLTIKNIKDESGNRMEETTKPFIYLAPYVPMPGELLITEIMADPNPPVGLPEVEYLEIYNNSGQDVALGQVTLSDLTRQTRLPDYSLGAGDYVVLASTGDVALFGETNVLGVSGFPSLGNGGDSLALSVENQTLLDVVVYSDSWYRSEAKSDGGYSLERLSFEDKCLPHLNWIGSADESGGTPGTENSLFNTEPDQTAPEIAHIELIADNSLEITFSETMDAESMADGSYDFSGGLLVEEVYSTSLLLEKWTVKLKETTLPGQLYTLTITGLLDCAGNKMEAYTFNFGKGEKPSFNELIITEIMADPDPEVGLPQIEYLEIYNTSDKNLELAGLTLRDANSEAEFPAGILLPHTYLLLIPTTGSGQFDETDVLPIPSWPSLSNGGECISIYDGDNQIFSVTYHQDWYKDGKKEDGGWSLEMIDIGNPCGESSNWTASIAQPGGTPGKENSVATQNPDNLGPQLVEAIAKNSGLIELVFDEKLNPVQFQNTGFTITPDLPVEAMFLAGPEHKRVSLSLADDMVQKTQYTVSASGIADCVGNLIGGEGGSASFVLSEPGVEGDIVLNEILFNPRSGGVDFVEVYNKSDKAINLKSWQLANFNSNGDIDPDIITGGDLIFLPHTFLVFTTSPTILKADYPRGNESTFVEMSPFPGYSDDAGSVILLDSLDNIIDLFDYDKDFHFALLDQVDGVSLERISFDGPTNNPDNWKSAASTAGFATPGLMNSQFKSPTQVTGTLTIEPKAFNPDNTGVNDFTTINYELQNAGSFANVNIYDPVGRLVKTLAQGDLLSTNGFFTWDGTDNSGARVRVGYYAIYFEIFDANGNKDIMKETVVLGARF